MIVAVERIQAQLRYSARMNYNAVAVPPFTLFFNPDDDSPYANYAIPDAPVGGDLRAPLAELRTTFAAWQRRPRFEFIDAYAPALPAALQANGFVAEPPTYLMLCTPTTFRPAPGVPGLTVALLPADAPVHELQELLSVLRQAFGAPPPAPVTAAEAAQHRQRYAGLQTFVARLDGRIVAAGSLTQPYAGLTELAGVGTLEAYRGRGVAAAVCAEAVAAAFAQGLDLAFLTAGDERAGRVYARVGFQLAGAGLAYSDPAAPPSP
jgi:RimJ/RimL family protein N-acetyltransferase